MIMQVMVAALPCGKELPPPVLHAGGAAGKQAGTTAGDMTQ
jgi:hypothetical protein